MERLPVVNVRILMGIMKNYNCFEFAGINLLLYPLLLHANLKLALFIRESIT